MHIACCTGPRPHWSTRRTAVNPAVECPRKVKENSSGLGEGEQGHVEIADTPATLYATAAGAGGVRSGYRRCGGIVAAGPVGGLDLAYRARQVAFRPTGVA